MREGKQGQRGMELTLGMNSSMELYGISKVWNGFPYNCMVISCPQTEGLLGFHNNQRFIESRVSKTLNGTR